MRWPRARRPASTCPRRRKEGCWTNRTTTDGAPLPGRGARSNGGEPMAIQPRPESGLSVGRFVRWGVHGGAAAALIPLLIGVSYATGWGGDAAIILAAGTILGG